MTKKMNELFTNSSTFHPPPVYMYWNPEKYTPMDHRQNWKTIITASLSLVFYVNSSPPGALGLS